MYRINSTLFNESIVRGGGICMLNLNSRKSYLRSIESKVDDEEMDILVQRRHHRLKEIKSNESIGLRFDKKGFLKDD